MTSKSDTEALRALVALTQKHIRVANSDAPYSVYEANKEILVGTLVDAIAALERMLDGQTAGMDVEAAAREIVSVTVYGGLAVPMAIGDAERISKIAAIIRKHCETA